MLRLRHDDEVYEEAQDEHDDEFSLDSVEERRAARRAKEVSRWTTDELLAAYAVQQGASRSPLDVLLFLDEVVLSLSPS